MQAQSLASLIDKKVTNGACPACVLIREHVLTPPTLEGYIGMAIVGGVAAVGALVAASLIRRATRK